MRCFIESARVQYSFKRRSLITESLITELVLQCEKLVNEGYSQSR